MKEHPILFSTPMVKAIMEDRKTMTRRVKGLKKINESPDDWRTTGTLLARAGCNDMHALFVNVKTKDHAIIKLPYGNVGDLLYVKEKHAPIINDAGEQTGWYHSTDADVYNGKWKSPLFMKKVAARIWLEVTGVRVERLCDISEEDAKKEGVELVYADDGLWKNYLQATPLCESAKRSFISLWHRLNKTNPVFKPIDLVWVIEFKKRQDVKMC